jgi:hypothetical protein
MSPSESTAAQNDDAGQEMPVRVPMVSTDAALQADDPPPGSLDVMTLPAESIAAQNVEDGQEMLESAEPSEMGVDQLSGEDEAWANDGPINRTSINARSMPTKHRNWFSLGRLDSVRFICETAFLDCAHGFRIHKLVWRAWSSLEKLYN